jgi:HSP20 family protein
MAAQQRTTEQGTGSEQSARGGAGSSATSGSATSSRGTEGARGEAERSIPTSGEGSRQQQATQTAPARRGERRPTRAAWPGFFPSGGIPVTPWELMRRMSDEVAQVLELLSAGQPGSGVAERNTGIAAAPQQATSGAGIAGPVALTPQIEVIERPDAVTVRADMPGINADDITVSVDEGVLTIQGERRREQREEQDGVVRTERIYGTFFRAIPLPDGADEERIEATFRNGVLEITVPVSRRQSGRRIEVRS